MAITVSHKEKIHELDIANKPASEMLKLLNIKSNTVLITRNGQIILDDEILEDNDTIKLLPTISGG